MHFLPTASGLNLVHHTAEALAATTHCASTTAVSDSTLSLNTRLLHQTACEVALSPLILDDVIVVTETKAPELPLAIHDCAAITHSDIIVKCESYPSCTQRAEINQHFPTISA
jgi:hypothetical protein